MGIVSLCWTSFIYGSLNKLCSNGLHKTQLTLFNLVRRPGICREIANDAKFILPGRRRSAMFRKLYTILAYFFVLQWKYTWKYLKCQNESDSPRVVNFICLRKWKASIRCIWLMDRLHPWDGIFTRRLNRKFHVLCKIFFASFFILVCLHALFAVASAATFMHRLPHRAAATGLATSRPDFNCGRLAIELAGWTVCSFDLHWQKSW